MIEQTGRITELRVEFGHGDVQALVSPLVSVVLALLPARRAVRRGAPRAVAPLRTVHNGSVNDSAASAIGGMVVVIAALAWQ